MYLQNFFVVVLFKLSVTNIVNLYLSYIYYMCWGVTIMRQQEKTMLDELKKMIQVLIEENEKLNVAVSELKEEQKKMQEEIKIQNIVLNSLPARTEILN